MTEISKPQKGDKMKAVAIHQFGGADEIQIQEFPVPKIAPDEVLIRVHTAGVGIWDAKEREGLFAKANGGKNPDFPKTLGREASGTILKIGNDVMHFHEGDKVYINGSPSPTANLYAEYATAKAKHVMPIPENLSMLEAGALPIAAITALTGLDDILKLQPHETIIIFGASGGLGHLAIQLAKAMGARVFGIASGKDGVDIVQKLGADGVVNGHDKHFIKTVKDFSPDGFDAALFTTGGKAANETMKMIKDCGRAAYPNGIDPEPKAIKGINLQAYSMNSSPEVYKKLNNLIEKDTFHVHIARSFPLEAAAEAHRQLNDHYVGKFVLEVI